MSRPVVITGGNGMVGRAVAAQLRARGDEVLLLSRKEADVRLEMALRSHARPAGAVIHLAFPTCHEVRAADPLGALHAVAVGTANVLRLAADCGARHVLLASSGKVYGRPDRLPVAEDHPLRAGTQLGELKRLQEEILTTGARRGQGFGATILRFFNGYGPGQRSGFLLPTLLAAWRDQDVVTLGDLDRQRDWVHARDMGSAFLAALDHPPDAGEVRVANVGSEPATPRRLVALMEAVTGHQVKVEQDPERHRPDEEWDEQADTTRLRSLGWWPAVSLEQGLRELWAGLSPP